MEKLLCAQKAYFAAAQTMDMRKRLDTLEKLRLALRHHESDLLLALHVDLGVSEESAAALGLPRVYRALEKAMGRLKRRIPMERIRQGSWNLPGSHERPIPWGTMLVIPGSGSPEEACLLPAIAALAAGNCLILCPPQGCRQTADVLKAVFEESFAQRHAALVSGSWDSLEALSALPFDRIWYAGGENGARLVCQAAAPNAVPVFCQIQGKNLAIVSHDADIGEAAKKIARAKFWMSGQTPWAPGCCLAAENVINRLLEALIQEIEKIDRESLPKMMDPGLLTRLSQAAVRHRLVYGGSVSHAGRRMEPTLLTGMRPQEAMEWMGLSGPVLPVAAFHTMEEGINALRSARGETLSYFSEDQGAARHVLTELPYPTMIWNGCQTAEKAMDRKTMEAVQKTAVIVRG